MRGFWVRGPRLARRRFSIKLGISVVQVATHDDVAEVNRGA
jgi:hypothetical protein